LRGRKKIHEERGEMRRASNLKILEQGRGKKRKKGDPPERGSVQGKLQTEGKGKSTHYLEEIKKIQRMKGITAN